MRERHGGLKTQRGRSILHSAADELLNFCFVTEMHIYGNTLQNKFYKSVAEKNMQHASRWCRLKLGDWTKSVTLRIQHCTFHTFGTAEKGAGQYLETSPSFQNANDQSNYETVLANWLWNTHFSLASGGCQD